MAAFSLARSLYMELRFEPCEPFGAHLPNPNSLCMTIWLRGTASAD
jgi:hypothetical protein